LYPDPDGANLAEAVAQKYGLDSGRILVAPGSDAVINWLVRGWAGLGDEVIYSAHGFQSYRIRALTAGAKAIPAQETGMRTDVAALLSKVTDRTKLMFVANPNNPTGTYLTPTEIRDLRSQLRSDIMLVVDEAYFDYVQRPDYETALNLVNNSADNVIVTRTFSKFYGLAGLRVGWAYVPATVTAPLARMRGPFAVSDVSLAAATAALEDAAYAQATLEHNNTWLPWLTEQIEGLGYETTDSVGNFVLMKLNGGEAAAAAFDEHLRTAGFVGRRAQQNNLPDWFRITVGPEDASRGIVEVIQRIASDNRKPAS